MGGDGRERGKRRDGRGGERRGHDFDRGVGWRLLVPPYPPLYDVRPVMLCVIRKYICSFIFCTGVNMEATDSSILYRSKIIDHVVGFRDCFVEHCGGIRSIQFFSTLTCKTSLNNDRV